MSSSCSGLYADHIHAVAHGELACLIYCWRHVHVLDSSRILACSLYMHKHSTPLKSVLVAQVLLCSLCALACCRNSIWVELHAQSQKQLDCEAGRGPGLVLGTICSDPGANRCRKYATGRQLAPKDVLLHAKANCKGMIHMVEMCCYREHHLHCW